VNCPPGSVYFQGGSSKRGTLFIFMDAHFDRCRPRRTKPELLCLFVPLHGKDGLFGFPVEIPGLGHDGLEDDLIAMLVKMVRIDARDHALGGRGCLEVDFRAERLDDRYRGLDHSDLEQLVGDIEIFGADAEGNFLADVGFQEFDMIRIRAELERAFVDEDLSALFHHFDGEEIHGGRADETGDEFVDGVVVHVERRADLLDFAVLHDNDFVAHGHGLDLVVGDVDHGGLEAIVQLDELGAHLDAELGVEVGERFVEEEYFGIAHDGAADRDALALAARKGFGPAFEQFLDVEDAGGFPDALFDLVFGNFADLETERHVVVHGHVRIQGVVLEHHRDVAILGRNIIDELAVDEDLAFGDVFETGDHAQGRGLAAAGRPDEYHEFLVMDGDVGVLNRADVALVHLADFLEFYFGHVASLVGLCWFYHCTSGYGRGQTIPRGHTRNASPLEMPVT